MRGPTASKRSGKGSRCSRWITQRRRRSSSRSWRRSSAHRPRTSPMSRSTSTSRPWPNGSSPSGYDERRKTLFIWQGVTQYLTPQAVDDTLAFVAGHSGPGSSIIFDYMDATLLSGPPRHGEVSNMRRYRRLSGEGLVFGIPIASIQAFLEARGFTQVRNADHVALEKAYLSGGNRPVGWPMGTPLSRRPYCAPYPNHRGRHHGAAMCEKRFYHVSEKGELSRRGPRRCAGRRDQRRLSLARLPAAQSRRPRSPDRAVGHPPALDRGLPRHQPGAQDRRLPVEQLCHRQFLPGCRGASSS